MIPFWSLAGPSADHNRFGYHPTLSAFSAGTRNPTYTYSYSIEWLTDATSENAYVYRFAEYEYGFVAPGADPRVA